MDDLEKAIKTLSLPGSSPEEKLESQKICDSVTSSVEGWKVCLEYLSGRKDEEVRFWCIGTLSRMLTNYSPSYPNLDARKAIRETILGCIREGLSGKDAQSYTRNKIAELYIQLVRADYPDNWPSAFVDITSLVASDIWTQDMFIRILQAFNTMIVCDIGSQTTEEAAIRRNIKDTMRTSGDLRLIVQTWVLLVSNNRTKQSSAEDIVLLSSAVAVLESYVSWMDLSYSLSDEVLSLVSGLLDPVESAVVLEALNFLSAILLKGMPSGAKLRLIGDLNVPMLLETRLSLDLRDVTPELFAAGAKGRWALLSNPEVASALERGPLRNPFADFRFLLLSARSDFLFKVTSELILALKNVSEAHEADRDESALTTGLLLFEKLLPQLTLLLGVQGPHTGPTRNEVFRLLILFFNFLSCNDPGISTQISAFKNGHFVSGIIPDILRTLLNNSFIGSEKTPDNLDEKDTTCGVNGRESLFTSLLELRPDLVCGFMDAVIESAVRDASTLALQQLDSAISLLARLGQASVSERKQISKHSDSCVPSREPLLQTNFLRLVVLLLESQDLIRAEGGDKRGSASDEIRLRSSILSVFRYFGELISIKGGVPATLQNGETTRMLDSILVFLLSHFGFKSRFSDLSYKSAKTLLTLSKMFSSHFQDKVQMFLMALRSHAAFGRILAFSEDSHASPPSDGLISPIETKALNTFCETVGFLLQSRLSATKHLNSRCLALKEFEELLHPLLGLAQRLITTSGNSTRVSLLDSFRRRCSLELIGMLCSVAEGGLGPESICDLATLWRASADALLTLARSADICELANQDWRTSLLAPMHRLVRAVGPAVCEFLVPLTEALLTPFIMNNSYEDPQTFLARSCACEELAGLFCHAVTLHGSTEQGNTGLRGLPKLFLNMIRVWASCWPCAFISQLNGTNTKDKISVLTEVALLEEVQQARQTIKNSTLKILAQMIKIPSTLDLLVDMCLLGNIGELGEAKMILKELALNPYGVNSSEVGAPTQMPPSDVLFREALGSIQCPVITFLIFCLSPTLSSPALWFCHSGDVDPRISLINEETTKVSLESLRALILRALTFPNRHLCIEEDIRVLGLEVLSSFVWFSVLDFSSGSGDCGLLDAQLAILKLLVNGEILGGYPSDATLSSNALGESRKVVLSGTRAALENRTTESQMEDSAKIRLLRRSVELFSGYHYFILLSGAPITGLSEEGLQLLDDVTNKPDPHLRDSIKKFSSKYQNYVRQVLL
ncbi:tRNA exportin type nuclear export protein [Cryptosporidium ryanae]|uniref:tRNA exportin type nuclear export protein n=1 Tax=Cryptosporidium ryanae TaxID=515981 RepID=UPI003519F3CC|nr:tRNA exportin type nuclear export protein [Cryptosporidium ryanae]